jgi:hypothetical protein
VIHVDRGDETEAILRFIATELGPGTYVNLMAPYHPAGHTSEFPEIDRHLCRAEFERARPTSSACAGSPSAAARRWDGSRPSEGGAHSSVRTAHRSGNAGCSSVVAR